MRESLPIEAPATHRRRWWPLLEAAALALALVAGLLVVVEHAGAAQPADATGQAPGLPAKPHAAVFTWTLLSPLDWVVSPVTCRVLVTNSDGLDAATAACQVSTNGGLNWSAGPAATSAYGSYPTSLYITATSISFPSSSADQNRVRFLVQDPVGTPLTVPTGTDGFIIKVDNAPPGPPTAFVFTPAWTNVNGLFSIGWTNPAELSGVVRAYYKFGSPPTSNSDYHGYAQAPGISSLSGLAVPGPGKHSISIWLQDAVGNVHYNNRNIAVDAFWYDPTPPSSSATVGCTVPGNGGWCRSPALVTLSASDPAPGSGTISRFEYKIDTGSWQVVPISAPPYNCQFTISSEGQHAVQYRATDGANNTEPVPNLVQVKIDTVRPSTTHGLIGVLGQNNWFISPVTVQLFPVDATSGVAATTYQLDGAAEQPGTYVPVNSDGIHQIRFRSLDQAGNQEDWQGPYPFQIDTRPPIITATLQPAQPPSGCYSGPVVVTLSASDPGGAAASGLASISYRIGAGTWITAPVASLELPPFTYDGIYALYYRASDGAGNISSTRSQVISIDRTGPVIRPDWFFSGTPGYAGWYRTGGTVTLQADDAGGCGVAQVYHRLDGASDFTPGQSFDVTGEGVHTFRAYAVDSAGNVGPVRVFTDALRIDTTAPVPQVLPSQPPSAFGWYSTTVVITLTAADNLSGVLSVEYRQGAGSWVPASGPLTISAEGQWNYELRASDLAGNVSATQPFTVYIDRTAPATPLAPVRVTPLTWTGFNNFTVTWINPSDLSGIGHLCYTVDQPPAPGVPPQGCLPVESAPTRASGVQVPNEGTHYLFVWLMDKAGNANPNNNRVAQDLLRYDATPPTNARATLSGTLGCGGYYVSPVQVRLRADDSASGVCAFTWLTSTTWYTTPTSGPLNEAMVTLSGDNKYTLRYKAIDCAGNEQAASQSVAVNLDLTAPGSPVDLQATPVGWSSVPTFTLSWLLPVPPDFSGIDRALYTLDRAPTRPSDGLPLVPTYNPITRRYEGRLTVPGEGCHTLYFWLQDRACNSDLGTLVTRSLCFDVTPPTTTLNRDRPPDYDTWYTRAVTVTLTASDGSGSGVHRTYYRVNDGPFQVGNHLVLDSSGIYTVTYYSTDVAGNQEPARLYEIRVDKTPPSAWAAAPGTSRSPQFVVSWGATDLPANRISRYWVQVRDGSGPWQTWQNETAQTSATFSGQRGHVYAFRVRARDEAGNESQYPADPHDATFVDLIVNGTFESGFDGWEILKSEAAWQASVVPGECGAAHAILLGSPAYDNRGGVPMGAVMLQQTVDLPALAPGQRLALLFRYRMITWDWKWKPTDHSIRYDTFEAEVVDRSGQEHELLVDGYEHSAPYIPERQDLGCRTGGPYDLTPYAGQRVQIRFANWNRYDRNLNTYTYLEDVRICILWHTASAPLAGLNVTPSTYGSSAAQPFHYEEPWTLRPPRPGRAPGLRDE